jgi:hypothetical protein
MIDGMIKAGVVTQADVLSKAGDLFKTGILTIAGLWLCRVPGTVCSKALVSLPGPELNCLSTFRKPPRLNKASMLACRCNRRRHTGPTVFFGGPG